MSSSDIESKVVKSLEEITIGPKKLTKYEKARIVGARALQLSLGAPPLIDVSKLGTIDPVLIAEKELELGVLPILIKRVKPNGEFQLIPVSILAEIERQRKEKIRKLLKEIFGEE